MTALVGVGSLTIFLFVTVLRAVFVVPKSSDLTSIGVASNSYPSGAFVSTNW